MPAQPHAPGERALDSDGPTREIGARDELRLGVQVKRDDVLKASLLAGTGGKIGRFHVLRLLGEGGMGMVFAAYDEELDRKVAIKLLRNLPGEGSIGRTRLLREAQALARLSHPNVVTVYEVGEFERQVFIAMEFVLGDTLYEWLRGGPRPWREVVRLFIEAGRGLAVAHAAEILHRDFKPANVLIGADGRVRVLDFGLALAQDRPGDPEMQGSYRGQAGSDSSGSRRGAPLTEVGSVLGTPAYMAPERYIAGQAIDARADQFSFCVALYEGLYGERPFPGRDYAPLRMAILKGTIPEPPRGTKVPKWLRKVVLRGLAVDPAQRYANMDALLLALARDPDRTRRWTLAGLGVASVLVAGGYGLAQATGELAVCPDVRERLGWDARRPEVEQAFLATQASYAADAWTRISGDLDRYAERWSAGHREACESHARGEQSAKILDMRMACLERRRGELTALVNRLAEADTDTVRAATAAVDGLPSPEICADKEALTAAVPLPEDPAVAVAVAAQRDRLAEARAAISTRKFAAGGAIVGEVASAAEGLDYCPLLAEALAVRGDLEDLQGEYGRSLATFTDALWVADSCRHDDVLASAMAGVIVGLGIRAARFEEALSWQRHAHAVITRIGEGSPGHTRLLRAFGGVLSRQGHDDESAQALALALRYDSERAEPDERAVVADLRGLGTTESMRGNQVEARRLLERALALVERLDGPNHPDVAMILNNLGGAMDPMGDLDGLKALYERALTISEAALGPDHADLAPPLTNLGAVYVEQKDLATARKLLERALAIDERVLGPDHLDLATGLLGLANVAINSGDFATARRHSDRALAIRERYYGAGSSLAAVVRAELGYLNFRQGKLPAAIRELERALALLAENPERSMPHAAPQARFTLAQALWDSGKRARATTLANQALAEFQALEGVGFPEDVADIEAWLAEKSPGHSK